MKLNAKIEFGDFQTPLALAKEVCELLRKQGEIPGLVIEPTCGQGTFLVAAAETFSRATLQGWDINREYVRQAAAALDRAGALGRSSVSCQDFFAHNWEAELGKSCGKLLVLGNLPWVTNSVVAAKNGSNLPVKENFLGLRGLAARTGKSNFDISEWMLIQLVRALRGRPATIAMLCKTATARKLLRYAWQNDGRIHKAALYRIDAAAHFGASVNACLLIARMGTAGPVEADVYDSISASQPVSRVGLAGRDLVADVRNYKKFRHLEGLCPFQWRSGIKHDCSGVMELRLVGRGMTENKLGEHMKLESEFLYPLLKCSDLANGRIIPERLVLVTQQRVGEDTSGIEHSAPRTWNYLQSHSKKFEARKSSIYKGRMPFALFGIGDYAFAPWKVAVSGLHKSPQFQVIGPVDGKPVFFDDTCYFLSFEDEAQARLVADILNSETCKQFILSLLFTDSKRPVTVELLQRLNLTAMADEIGYGQKWRAFQRVSYTSIPAATQFDLVMETFTPAPPVKNGKKPHTLSGYSRKGASKIPRAHKRRNLRARSVAKKLAS